ncbi:hypothetical protein V502_11459, partial [Pseudogymnoascus sp. VKM F-4520 (FW-2644)]
MAEPIGPVPSGVEEPVALPVPSPGAPQKLPESSAGEAPKDGVELSIAVAGDNSPSDISRPQPTTIDASHTAPAPVTLPPTSTLPVNPIPDPTPASLTAAAPQP